MQLDKANKSGGHMNKIEIINMIPKFLSFYNEANKESAGPDRRWELWKERYRFAAVPPGDEGMKTARTLLDNAWNQYHEHIDWIKQWQPNSEKVHAILSDIQVKLGCQEDIDIALIYFVGAFDNNAFVAPYSQNRLALCLPVENGDSDILIAHELTHIVHAKTAQLSGTWERTIATVIIQEGLAAHMSKEIVPDQQDAAYIEYKAGWLQECHAYRNQIIKGIIPFLQQSSSEVVTKFTIGKGTTNHEREAYYVGWVLVQNLLARGSTFKEIAHIQEQDLAQLVKESLVALCQ